MTLAQLTHLIVQHGITLTLTAEGKLRPSATRPPPPELLAGIRQHRAPLIARLERGQRADGRYYLPDLLARSGICASCARWQAEPGNLLGGCKLGGGEIHAAHRCPVGKWVQRQASTGRAA